MKKTFLKAVALMLVAVVTCAALASCTGKKLSGDYYFGDKLLTKSYTQYSFSGSKVDVAVYLGGNKVTDSSYEAKYSIKDDEITFTWEDADGEKHTNTQTFEELDNGSIKIGAITFKKAEK